MEITNKITGVIAKNKMLWYLFKPMVKFASGIQYNRKLWQDEIYVNEIKKVFSKLEVIHGPFGGMRYPDYTSFGSAVFPKLLGSYESELNGVWDEVLKTQYDNMIDVGSAEGYFSVGFALKGNSKGNIIAVDISSKALQMCKSIASLNGISDKLEYQLGIDSKGLAAICMNKKCFILCDSEGFEKELFTAENIQSLTQSDVLIEVHDSRILGVSSYLTKVFEATHSLRRISSTDDIQKFNEYDYPELKGLSDRAKLIMVSENRSNIQEWFYFKPKAIYLT